MLQRIHERTFPSIALPGSSFVEGDPVRWVPWDTYDPNSKHDINYFGFSFDLIWHLTPKEPTYGLSTRRAGDLKHSISRRQEFSKRNPNFITLPEVRMHNHFSLDAFPPDSDFWLKNREGFIKADVDWDEFTFDMLNPEVQQLLINRIIGIAECGIYDGVLLDGFQDHGAGYYSHLNIATDEEIIAAHEAILKGVRERARDDFLILANGNRDKLHRYTEYVNGSFMETVRDNSDGYTYAGLIEIEDTLLWNEINLREPRINVLEGHGVFEPFESPNNLRWMRLFTTMGLTHSDGYVIFRVPKEIDGHIQHTHIWYAFWDADLGRPIREIGQLYENRDGVFIREFSNGWAVYNRSGKAQEIRLRKGSTGWHSGYTGIQHTLPDLDGEIYLKLPAWDVNGDGKTDILDLVRVANAINQPAPDVNGDGIVNVLDLVLVANHIGE